MNWFIDLPAEVILIEFIARCRIVSSGRVYNFWNDELIKKDTSLAYIVNGLDTGKKDWFCIVWICYSFLMFGEIYVCTTNTFIYFRLCMAELMV